MIDNWTDFYYRDFCNVPRKLWFQKGNVEYQFESEFDLNTETYSRFYTISVRHYNKYKEICACPIESVKFDITRKKYLDASILDELAWSK